MSAARPKHQWIKPDGTPERYCTFSELVRHLKSGSRTIRSHCKALGIDIQPGRRNDRYPSGRLQRKRYKRHLRLLTKSEATRIIVRHYELKGRRVQKAAEAAKEP